MEVIEFKDRYYEDRKDHGCFKVESSICPYCNFGINFEYFPGVKDFGPHYVFIGKCPRCSNYSLFISDGSETYDGEIILLNLIQPKTHKPLSDTRENYLPPFAKFTNKHI